MLNNNKKKGILLLILTVLAASLLFGCSGSAKDTARHLSKIFNSDKPLQVKSVSEGKYAYETLDADTKLVYDEIVYTIQNRREEARIATADIAVMEKAYLAVRYDYSEFFWLDKFSYVTYRRGDKITAIDITPTYSMTKKEQASVQKKIDAQVKRILSKAPTDGTDYDKALYVYETLITNVDYVEDSKDNQNIISVFLNHETICQGYAYATQYLLERLDIPCTTVVGSAEGENHAWNLVQLDGEYYYMDTTWGNSQYIYRLDSDTSSMGMEGEKYIDYDYFAATTDTLMATHQADERIPLPECTAVKDNYYVHENRYIKEWDPEKIGGLIRDAYEGGERQIQIKFSDMELFEQALQYFIEEYRIVEYCRGLDSVRYMENSDNNVLFLQFPVNET